MEEIPRLTSREWDVLKLLLQGKSNKQIAWALSVSERTVEFHLKNIYAKFGVGSRIELILKLGKLTGGLDAEKLEHSTVAHRVKTAENRAMLDRWIDWAKPILGKEIEMKALISKHALLGIVTALFTGFAWIAALTYTQNLFPKNEVKSWVLLLLFIFAISGQVIGFVGKHYGHTAKRVLISTVFGVGLSPFTIIPSMMYIVIPVGRIADWLGFIDASSMPETVATKLTLMAMITIWLFASLAMGIVSLFLTFKKTGQTFVHTQVSEQSQ